MTLVEKRLYLRVLASRRTTRRPQDETYESVKKPEAATPQMRKFHELRSNSYRS